jgi:Flp pilus assembly protein TadG
MAMVETVIVLPLLLMVLFAVVEFGIVFGRWQAISNAAREGARLAIVFQTSCDELDVESRVTQRVEEYVAPLGLGPSEIEVEIDGACGPRGSPTIVTVDSTYTFWVLPGFAESVSPSLDLRGRSEMRNEGSGS